MSDFYFSQNQRQTQKQVQKLSQNLVYGLKILQMSTNDLRKEIYKTVNLNPALEIVNDPANQKKNQSEEWEGQSQYKKQDYQAILEASEDKRESLQEHLMHQLNATKLSPDEYDLCQKLIYNLDRTGCYGSMRSPESLIDKKRPMQTKALLEKCIDRIQKMDPVGTCCKNLEESLFVQAKISGDASDLTLFILDGHLDFLNPPESERVLKKINEFISEWHKKSFAKKLEIEDIKLSSSSIADSINYILHLNPHPASDYSWDSGPAAEELPDIVLNITRESGHLPEDDFSRGKVSLPHSDFHLQVKYASGILPEIRLSPAAKKDYDRQTVEEAKSFLNNILFRQNTIVLQGCAIVKNQLEFFEKGPGHIKPLTRKDLADQLGIHESTVSRMSAKKASKYIQTEFGLFPASYFFSSAVKGKKENEKFSAEAVKTKMAEILSASEKALSDNELTKILNQKGIMIARRTVAKYRKGLGIENSYERSLQSH